MTRVISFSAVVLTAFALCAPAAGQGTEDSGAPSISKHWRAVYDVDADGRVEETISSRDQVVHESGIERLKVGSISFSTSIQTGEVLQAYTLKKDGRQIPVPAGNYQTEVNDGRRGAGPVFSDRTRISVVFPDLAVGDTVHLAYRLKQKEPMFPGHFSVALSFSPFVAYEDARVTVRIPRELKVASEAYFMQASEAAPVGGKRILEWHYSRLQPRQWTDDDNGLWRLDEVPGVLVSTFPTYEAIAKAYGDRALPKAVPTARVRELAQQVMGSEAVPRERARLLYEWVSRNLTYGGNCIGVGAVVPRDLDVVLDNKMGDCKDHATLLQALLAAAGIRSEQVLINAGNRYELAHTPVVSLVNHVINFLPDFNLYLDATAKEVPFGYLPGGTHGKPVIHVGAAKALATVPDAPGDQNEQRLRMKLKLAGDGSASGDMRVSLKGMNAATARGYMRNLTREAERDFVKRALAGSGYKGKGTVTKGETSGLSDQYEFSITFQVDNFLTGGTVGAFVLAPVMATPLSVLNLADAPNRNVPKRREECFGFRSYEHYEIDLAPGLTLIELPPDAQTSGSLLDYSATYRHVGSVMTVQREVHDKTATSICSPQISADLLRQALPVAENLKTQVLYKRPAR